jgi:nucleoside-diphosphate-sugar epimerase
MVGVSRKMSVDPIGNIQSKRLVILGAGYVGSALAREALARGHAVTALTRNAETAQSLQQLGVKIVVADLARDTWHSAIGAADWVVNCVSSGRGGSAGYQHSYVDGLRSIQCWLQRIGKVDTLVYTSSTSVYPQIDGIVTEASNTATSTGNAALLLEAEKIVAEIGAMGLARAAVVLRLSGIYGPQRHHLLDQLRSSTEPIAGKGEHRLNLIHRDDIVSAIFAALAIGPIDANVSVVTANSLFNVTDDLPVRKSDLIEWLASEIGVAFPGFSGQPVPGRRVDPPDRTVSNAKIKKDLGWRPRFPDFKVGYRQILGA